MPVVYHCPHCAQPVTVPDHMLGQAIGCPRCRNPFQTLPPAPPPPAAPPAPPPAPRGTFEFGGSSASSSDDGEPASRVPAGFSGPRSVERLSPTWQRVHFGVWLTRLAPVLSIFAVLLGVGIVVADQMAGNAAVPAKVARYLAIGIIAIPILVDIAGRWMGTAVRNPNGQTAALLATGAAGAFLMAWLFGALSGGRSRNELDQIVIPLVELGASCVALGCWLWYIFWLGKELDAPKLCSEVVSFCWVMVIGLVLTVGFVIGGALIAVQNKSPLPLLAGVLLGGCVELFVFVQYIQLLSAAMSTIVLRAPTRKEEAAQEAAEEAEDEAPLELD